jgi:signal transduction histidine kinase
MLNQLPINALYFGPSEPDFLAMRGRLAQCDGAAIALDWAAQGSAQTLPTGKQPDIYLVDHHPGAFDGLGLVREMAGKGATAPLILLMSQEQRSVAADALQAGAADCLFREQLTPPLLERAIRYALQLKQALESARQASKMEAVGRLGGAVAHSLNNLLTSVLGFSEILLTMNLAEPDGRDALHEIKKAGERAVALIAQLVAFSRRRESRPSVVDVNTVVRGVESLLRCALGSRMEIVLDLDPRLLPVQADLEHVLQIIMTMALSAREAMPGGSRLLFKTTNAGSDDPMLGQQSKPRTQHYVVLTMQDSGQAMAGTTPVRSGTPVFRAPCQAKNGGFLRAGVSNLVGQCGGFCDVKTAVGGRMTFSIYLPALERRQQSSDTLSSAHMPRLSEKSIRSTEPLAS